MKLKRNSILLNILLLCILYIEPAASDQLSELPAAWRDQLQAVTLPDLLKLTDEEKQRAIEVRNQLSVKLKENSRDTRGLAALYGELGAIYQILHVDAHAERCYNNARSLDPGEFRWAYYQAYSSHNNGDLQTAQQRYHEADKLKPGYLPLQYRLADIYLEHNQLDKAAAIFNELLQHEKFTTEANSGLGQIALLKHEYDKAIDHLDRALELQPEALSLHYKLGQAYRGKGDRHMAREHFNLYQDIELSVYDPLVQKLESTLTPELLVLGDAMKAVQKKDYETAIGHFEKGLESFPSNASARTSYARALYLNGDIAEARKQLEQALQHKPDKTITLFLLALLDDAEGHAQQAVNRYKKVIELKPNHEGAHFFLGNYYLRNRDYQNAVKHYDAALESGSKNILAVVYRLAAQLAVSKTQRETRELIAEANHNTPGIYPLIRLQILVLALSDDENVRDLKTARKVAQEIVEQQPAPMNIELLAIVYAAEGRFDEASKQIARINTMLSQMPYAQNKKFQSRYTRAVEEQRSPALDLERELSRLMPRATDPTTTFLEYPDPRPIM